MAEQLAARFFEGERPSDTRLVQIWMSKQRPAEKWMAEELAYPRQGLILHNAATGSQDRGHRRSYVTPSQATEEDTRRKHVSRSQ